MPKYSTKAQDSATSVRAKASNLRVHFKNTYEVAQAIKGMPLKKAQFYLNQVIAHKDIVPFRKFTGGIGRHAQIKKYKIAHGRWPEKSCRSVLDLLQNAESNAEGTGLDADSLYIKHIQTNRAPKQRRRTYRAHGRINPYMSCPTHIELILEQKTENVARAADSTKASSGKLGVGATASTQ